MVVFEGEMIPRCNNVMMWIILCMQVGHKHVSCVMLWKGYYKVNHVDHRKCANLLLFVHYLCCFIGLCFVHFLCQPFLFPLIISSILYVPGT